MDNWFSDWFDFLKTAPQETERFLLDCAIVLEDVLVEIDEALADTLEPVFDLLLGLEEVAGEASQPFVQTVHPILQDHAVCVGCRHYHGQSYNDNLLICAMHPYGCEGETCPDWQSTWEDASHLG